MSGLSAAEHAEIDLSLGAVVVSNYLSYLTMGVVLSATWTYFSKFPTDRWWFKALVILCVGMSISDTIATGIWTYDWAVTNYANPTALTLMHWALPAEGLFLSTCGVIVQLFYVWRLWIMSDMKNWVLPAVIGCLSIMGWCTMCWVTHVLATHSLISDFTLLLPVIYIWLGGSVGADVLITGSMIYYLDLRFRIKNQASYNTQRRFREIILRTVECNLLSLFAQAIAVGLFNYSSRIGYYFVIADTTLAKVYTFSLLVSLNSRTSDNNEGTSKGGRSLSRREEGGELTVFRTSSFPSTHRLSSFLPSQVSGHIQEVRTSGDWPEQTKGPVFDVFDTEVLESPV